MAAPVKNPPVVHVIVAPMPSSGIDYFAVKSPNGQDTVRAATLAEAQREQARLNLRDSYTIR